jgi:hypothetical protein
MDQSSKIAALEEEVSVLKGEIKAILKEVRAAVLAQDNPFAGARPEPLPSSPRQREEPVGAEPAPPRAAPAQKTAPAPAEPAPEPDAPAPQRRTAPLQAIDLEPDPPALPTALRPTRRVGVQTLATLIAWTQEAAQQFSPDDMQAVLAFARYGGLIDPGLEETLAGVFARLEAPAERRPATVGEYLLALRELDALLGEEREGRSAGRTARQAS